MGERDNEVPPSVLGNIDTVLAIEQRADHEGSTVGRLAHGFGNFVGSITFLAIHAAAFILWMLVNAGPWPRFVFDPYPFDLLGMLVSVESVVLTTFVLIKQNREGDRAKHRSHLDLQVNLLSEKEITKVLQIVQRIADRVGVESPDDADLAELLGETAVGKLAEELKDKAADSAAKRA